MPTLVLLLTWREKDPDARRLTPARNKAPTGSDLPVRPDCDQRLNPIEKQKRTRRAGVNVAPKRPTTPAPTAPERHTSS